MNHWKTSMLGELVEPASTWNPANAGYDQVFDYIDLSAVDQEAKLIRGAQKLIGAEAPSRARQLVAKGDVLVSTVRPNLNGVARVPEELDGATASTGFCILRARSTVLDRSYLFHWVKSPAFIGDMVRKATGASYPAVSDRIIFESKLPLPPLEEQRRIAEVLDQAEALRAKRRAALAQLDTLTQSIFLDLFGDPVANTKGWPRLSFGNLLTNIDSGWSPICLDRPVMGDEWGILKLGAVTWCEYDSAENKALPPEITPDPELEVKAGDLLFTRKNTHDLVAACALVRSTPPRLLMSDLIFRFCLRPDAEMDERFLHRLLIYPTKRKEMQRLAGGSASSMPNISKERLQSAPIERPPLALQRDFANRLEQVEKLRATHRTALAELNNLFLTIQHRAFLGELWK
jgi:type I restriction enzyme S subunit